MKKITVLIFTLTLVFSEMIIIGSVGSQKAFAASPQIGYLKRKGRKVSHRAKYKAKYVGHKTAKGTRWTAHKTKRGTKTSYYKTKRVTKHTYSKTKNKIEH